jgi:hypothetical protein
MCGRVLITHSFCSSNCENLLVHRIYASRDTSRTKLPKSLVCYERNSQHFCAREVLYARL